MGVVVAALVAFLVKLGADAALAEHILATVSMDAEVAPAEDRLPLSASRAGNTRLSSPDNNPVYARTS